MLVIQAFVSCVGLLDSKRDTGDTGDRFVGAYVEVEETCAPGGVVLDISGLTVLYVWECCEGTCTDIRPMPDLFEIDDAANTLSATCEDDRCTLRLGALEQR